MSDNLFSKQKHANCVSSTGSVVDACKSPSSLSPYSFFLFWPDSSKCCVSSPKHRQSEQFTLSLSTCLFNYFPVSESHTTPESLPLSHSLSICLSLPHTHVHTHTQIVVSVTWAPCLCWQVIDESLDVKEVVYSAERVSVMHDDELVSIAPPQGSLGDCSYQ